MKCIWTVRLLCADLFTSSETHPICSLNPILTMRFVVSLKRSADPACEHEWQLKHFSSVHFGSGASSDTRISFDDEGIEMDPAGSPNRPLQTREP